MINKFASAVLLFLVFACVASDAEAIDVNYDLQYLETGDYLTMFDAAIEHLEPEVKAVPPSINARFALGVLYFDRERYVEAKKEFEEILKQKPDDAESSFYVGLLYRHENNDDKFIESMERTIKVNPTHIQAYNRLATHYAVKGQFEKAKQVWDLAQSHNAKEESFYVNQAILHWSHFKEQKDHLDVVINNLNEAIKLRPREQSYFLLGSAHWMKEQYDAARTSLQKALELNPKNVNALLTLANVYVQMDDLEQAIRLAEKAKTLKPDDKEIQSEIRELKREYEKRRKHKR
jgi:tetratricopeptide (TPR) repeat protein